jgi:hypothetical protein
VIKLLPRGCKWTSQYSIDDIRPEIWALHIAGDRRKLVIHADNARPHLSTRVGQYMEEHGLRTALHPPYFPDRAPRDFFPFGYVKSAPRIGIPNCGRAFGIGSSNFECDSNRIIDSRISRVDRDGRTCIDTDGEYVE